MDEISALIDGELDEREASRQLSRTAQQEELRKCWEMFHLIGDTMRGDCRLSPHFSRRIAERLALEPTILAPRRRIAKRVTAYVLSAAASLSAVALVAWVAFSANPLSAPQEVAKVQAPPAAAPVTAAPQLASIPSAPGQGNMSEYLLAHQEFSPSTALQGVAPYIRSVSASQPLQNR
ncbi:MAG: sigma-E factor negative regulatory protein [Burkholderiales bacterium]|nr:sigma-E factor negative regulatory protein [Burkholderiales bacterium]